MLRRVFIVGFNTFLRVLSSLGLIMWGVGGGLSALFRPFPGNNCQKEAFSAPITLYFSKHADIPNFLPDSIFWQEYPRLSTLCLKDRGSQVENNRQN